MQLQTIVYVTDMDRSLTWYSQLFDRPPSTASSDWSTFEMGGATLALHSTDRLHSAGSISLSFVVPAPLERVAKRVPVSRAIEAEPFGRSFVVSDPDGALIQINEHT